MYAQDFILDKLKLLKSMGLKKIVFGIPGPEPPENYMLSPAIRFNSILSGSKIISLPLKNGAREILFESGFSHFSLPDSWEGQSWNTPHEMLCIVPRYNYLRISYYQIKENKPETPDCVYYHTNQPYSEAFRHTLKAMAASAYLQNTRAYLSLARAIIDFAIEECSQAPRPYSSRSAHTFEQIRTWVENSFQEDIGRETVAQMFNVSPSYVSQLFKKMCGQSFHEYLTSYRIDFAKYLLRETDLTASQITDQCGFKSYVHFVRRFREVAGLPPGKYRETFLRNQLEDSPQV